MRIVEPVFGFGNRCERQAEFLAFGHQFLLAHPAENSAETGQNVWSRFDALPIGFQRGIGEQFVQTERLTKYFSLPIAKHAHEHQLAVAGFEIYTLTLQRQCRS